MATPLCSLEQFLDLLATPWVAMGGGRERLARKNLPGHFREPSPNVIVVARADESDGDQIVGAYRLQIGTSTNNICHVPSSLPWQIVLPDGRRILVFTWINWKRNSRSLFEKSLRAWGREPGTVTPQGQVQFLSSAWDMSQCRIIHFGQVSVPESAPVRRPTAASAVSWIQRALQQTADEQRVLDEHGFDEADAHDEAHIASVMAAFRRRFTTYARALTAKLGEPTDTGTTQQSEIPVNGVFQYAVWNVEGRGVYLVSALEDVGLPCVLVLGTCPVKRPRRRDRR